MDDGCCSTAPLTPGSKRWLWEGMMGVVVSHPRRCRYTTSKCTVGRRRLGVMGGGKKGAGDDGSYSTTDGESIKWRKKLENLSS